MRIFHKPPGQTFVVHGEATASEAFIGAIKDQLDWKTVHAPKRGEFIEL